MTLTESALELRTITMRAANAGSIFLWRIHLEIATRMRSTELAEAQNILCNGLNIGAHENEYGGIL